MGRQRVSFFERTIEKWLLGLGAAGALTVAAYYVLGTPNRVRYGDGTAGPRELDALILADARALQRRVQSAAPEAFVVPEYARQVRRSQESSHSVRLIRSTVFGWTIPRIVDSLEPDSAVALVTPLAPDRPVARVGAHAGSARDEAESPPTDLIWATVAAYFDLQRQIKAMADAAYASHRRGIHVVRVDLQRQDVLADGEGGDWYDVRPAEGISVKTELPRPVFDDDNGRCLNRAALAAALARVKALQAEVMQPAFLERVVTAGGWRMPALDGYRQREEAVVERLETELREIRRLMGRKDFAAAKQRAQQTRDHALATSDIVRDAERLLKIIERRMARIRTRKTPDRTVGPGGDAPISRPGALSEHPVAPGKFELQPPEDQFIVAPGSFVRHPEDGRPAVWFHDTSVEPGGRYRYRLRVRLWNRYAGLRRPLIDPAGAEEVELTGLWSSASEIVEMPESPGERG